MKACLDNYADDNTLSASSTNAASLMELSSEGYNTTIDWLIPNHIIANPKKFQTIAIAKRNLQNTPAILSIKKITIKPNVSVLFFGVTIGDKLTSAKHINKHCRS